MMHCIRDGSLKMLLSNGCCVMKCKLFMSIGLMLLRTLVSSGKKNSSVHRFKGKHGKLYIIGKLHKCRFWKKM